MSLQRALLTAGLAFGAISSLHAAPVLMSGTTLDPITLRTRQAAPVKLSLGQTWSHLSLSNGSGVSDGLPPATQGPDGAVGALNFGKVKVTATPGAWVHESSAEFGTRIKRATRFLIGVDGPVDSMTVDNATGQIQTLQNAGGFTWTAPAFIGLIDGGSVTFRNLRVDLVGKQVLADIEGVYVDEAGTPIPGTETRQANTPVWTFETVAGPATIPTLALAKGDTAELTRLGFDPKLISKGRYSLQGKLSLQKLTITNQALAWLEQTLGTSQGSTFYNYIEGLNTSGEGWGSWQATYKLVMPEDGERGRRDDDRR